MVVIEMCSDLHLLRFSRTARQVEQVFRGVLAE